MAQPTNYKISTGVDLNAVFAPINPVDYGTLSAPTIVDNAWVSITPTLVNSPNNNVSINNNALIINNTGVYRLNIALNFGTGIQQSSQVVFVLSSTSTFPDIDSYVYIPSPNMSNIYAMNITGGNGRAGQLVQNNLNNINLGNCLVFNQSDQTNFDKEPYFVRINLTKGDTGTGPSRPNFLTIDITFIVNSTPQNIFPQIRLIDEGANPSINLANSKWMLTRISNI